MNTRIQIIGIGQSLRGDDAAGLEAVGLWLAAFPATASRPEVQAVVLELPGLDLLAHLQGASAAVLVDALHLPDAPGRLHRLDLDQAAAFGPDSASAHGWGVAETLLLGRSLYPDLAECRLVLIGLAGRQFQPGAGLSPEVRSALPQAARAIELEVQRLLAARS